MTETLVRREWLLLPLCAAAALLYGALIALYPLPAIGLVVVLSTCALAFLAPVTHLSILIFLTTVVPYSINNKYALGAGEGSPGLLLSDLFLFTGLARTATVLPRIPLDRRRLTVLGVVLAFVLWAGLEAYQGIRQGRSLSEVGAELRTLAGFSAALIAMGVLVQPSDRVRLARALIGLGLLLGLWGMAQWLLNLPFGSDFGVRAGVRYASGARGQVQGGLLAFPIAVTISAAALMSGQIKRRGARVAVVAVLVINALALLLTFERTFWVVAALGVGLVAVRAGRARRGRALVWTATCAIVGLAAVGALSPSTLQTAQARLLSIGQYGNDDSLRYRRVESDHVVRQIAQAPLVGSGLAASIWWGQPWNRVPPKSELYTHNGYLWLVWRLGLIGASLLLLLVVLAIAWRAPTDVTPLFASVRVGAQTSLLGLLIAAVTFPAFNGYGITTAMGVLIGISALPRLASQHDMLREAHQVVPEAAPLRA